MRSQLEALSNRMKYRKKLRDALTVSILKIDRGQRLLIIQTGNLLGQALQLNLLQMNIDRHPRAVRHPRSGGDGRIHAEVKEDIGGSERSPPSAASPTTAAVPPLSLLRRVRAGRPRGRSVRRGVC